MAHAEATAEVPVDVDTLWQLIGTFQGVDGWHPMLTAVEGDGEEPGARRTATTADGSQQVERLHEVAPTEHRYTYVMESTGMPVADYVAQLSAQPADRNNTSVRWSADFNVTSGDQAQAVDMVQGFLGAGLEHLKALYR